MLHPQLRRPLPSNPQFDRSLLQAPLPFWAAAPACNKAANALAAQTNAHQRSRSGFDVPSAPTADFSKDLFRSRSLGTHFGSNALPAELSAELSLRASSMPGSYQDIAARLHLNRAGITTATTSMIPVMSQEWLVIPFGTAQQLLPVYAGDVLAEPDGDAVMLIDETGQNWPMKCIYSRCLYLPYVLKEHIVALRLHIVPLLLTNAGLPHICVRFLRMSQATLQLSYASKLHAQVSVSSWHITAAHCERHGWHLQELSSRRSS